VGKWLCIRAEFGGNELKHGGNQPKHGYISQTREKISQSMDISAKLSVK